KIEQSLSYAKSAGYHLREPKTKTSNRSISISTTVLNEELQQHYQKKLLDKRNAKELWYDHMHFFVFTGDLGKPLYPTYPDRYYNRFCQRHNFKKIRFHDLRHTHVNFLMNRGSILWNISVFQLLLIYIRALR